MKRLFIGIGTSIALSVVVGMVIFFTALFAASNPHPTTSQFMFFISLCAIPGGLCVALIYAVADKLW